MYKLTKHFFKRELPRSFFYSFSIFFALLAAGTALAWTGPLSAPPACTSGNPGCDAPLNVSGNAQAKAAGLLLNTGGAANGLIVQYGSVGIGTVSPGATLTVQGGTAQLNVFTTGGAEALDWPTAGLSIRRIDDYTTMRMLQLGHSNDSTYQTGDSVWNFSLIDDTGSKTTSNSNTSLRIGGPGNLILAPGGNLCLNGSCISSWSQAAAVPSGTMCGMSVNGNLVHNCMGHNPRIDCPAGYTSIVYASLNGLGLGNWIACFAN